MTMKNAVLWDVLLCVCLVRIDVSEVLAASLQGRRNQHGTNSVSNNSQNLNSFIVNKRMT
jgi:hypothetical protein